MKEKIDTKRLVLLASLTGILLLLSFTPLGYLNIGPLAISLNMVPVAIGAIACGPTGGAALGAVFGITSCLQCVGIGGSSAMGMLLFEINPVLALLQRLIPRVLAGLFAGFVYIGMKNLCKKMGLIPAISGFVTGFSAALLNTVLFMAALVLMFGRTEYLQGLINGQNILLFVCTFVGINALVEMLAATLIVGAVSSALKKARLIGGE